MKRLIEKTDDGSATLYVPELNEHYHSTKGAYTESEHIFINMGLKASAANAPRILEIGLGTGLNAWLTLIESEKSQRNVHYIGIERYPLEWEMIAKLNYVKTDETLFIEGTKKIALEYFQNIHNAPWETATKISPHFVLEKYETDANLWLEIADTSQFDIIYFDAFAPEKQPEMWSQGLFDLLYKKMAKDGILTTYCAKGVVRRMLQTAGFTVERLPGPPGGKREILRARKYI